MLNKIIAFSLKNKLMVMLFVIALIIVGIFSLVRLPIDAVPDITNNQVQVITISPSNGPEDIERLVTFPVEMNLSTIPGIVEIRSFSRFGLSVVTIVFEEERDIFWARQQVQERLVQVREMIPEGIGLPELAPITTGLGEIYQYVLAVDSSHAGEYTAMELRTIQDWVVRRQLLGVPGVADVSSFGGFLKQYEVALDPEKMRALNINIADVFDALKANNQNTGGAYIDKYPNSWFVKSIGLIGSIEDIENIVVKYSSNGTPLFIRTVGTVQFGHAIRYGAMTYRDHGEAAGGIVMMLKNENSNEVIQRVKARIEEIQHNLPEGITIEAFIDRAKLVNAAVKTVKTNLLEGALIVIFVLVLMLGNLRGGIIVASVIFLSMLFAIIMMRLFGVSGNLMSLGAIDFGLIVDGAVIIVEATLHHLMLRKGQRLTQKEMDTEVQMASSRMMNAAAFGQIIILIVYLPILTLVGIEGKMFKPMAQTISFAILGAMVLSLTYVPVISSWVLSKKITDKVTLSDKLMERLNRVYQKALKYVIHHGKTIVAAAVILFAVSAWTFSKMGGEFIPNLDEGDFAIETRVLTGSSLSKTVEVSTKASKLLLENFPEVEYAVGKIGSSEIPVDPMPVELCDLIITLRPRSEWKSAKTKEELGEKMKAVLEEHIPGVTFGFLQPIQMRFNELMSGARQDVVVKIFGEDLNKLAKYAKELGRLAADVEGAEDLYIEEVTGLPQVIIRFDRARLAQYGLTIESVNRTISAGYAGAVAGQVFEGERRFDLVVRLQQDKRADIELLRNLYITTSNGNQVPLSQIAEVNFEIGPNQIQREDAKRRITVGFNVRGRDVASVVGELREKAREKIKLETGYSIAYGGTFQNLEEAKERLSIALPVALLLILLLLYFTFKSLKYGLLIFTAIPLSAIGGIFALSLRNMPFSISAGVGFIALFGVAVLNGIVLVSEFNRLKKAGITSIDQIIYEGTATRLRPVLMTALVASLGFIPMALSYGSGAEVQRPLATVVIGGLVSATLLTLFVLPCLYRWLEQKNVEGKHIKVIATGFILLLINMNTEAQQTTSSLEDLQERVINNHLQVKASLLEVEAARTNLHGVAQWGKTNFDVQYGQMNTYYWDNNISLNQQIPNPSAIAARRKLARAQVSERMASVDQVKTALKYEVALAYYEWAHFMRVRRWLNKMDSIYAQFQKAASVKYRVGETNLLEQTTAEVQWKEIQMQKVRNEREIKAAEINIQRLLMKDTIPVMSYEPVQYKETNISRIDLLHPQLFQLQKRKDVAFNELRLEKANRLPGFNIGYFNQTIVGYANVDGVERYFGSGKRFQGLNVGVAVNIFDRSFKQKVKLAAINQQIAEQQYNLALNNFGKQYYEAWMNLQKVREEIKYYETAAMPNVALLLEQSTKSYQAGELEYVSLLQALKTVSDVEMNYLNALYNLAQSNALIQYYEGNK